MVCLQEENEKKALKEPSDTEPASAERYLSAFFNKDPGLIILALLQNLQALIFVQLFSGFLQKHNAEHTEHIFCE